MAKLSTLLLLVTQLNVAFAVDLKSMAASKSTATSTEQIKMSLTEAARMEARFKGKMLMKESEIKALYGHTFEPLSTVLERAEKKGSSLSVDEALQRVGHRLPADITMAVKPGFGFLQKDVPNATMAQVQVAGAPAPSVFGKGTKLEKAMNFLNDEFSDVREKMDIKLFECGFFKVSKETALNDVQADIDRLAEEIGMLEKDIEYAKLQIDTHQRELEKLQTELADFLASCQETREALVAEKKLIEEDLSIAKLILDIADKECQKKTFMLEIKTCKVNGATTYKTGSDEVERAIAKLRTPEARNVAQQVLSEAAEMEDESDGEMPYNSDMDDDSFLEVDSEVKVQSTGSKLRRVSKQQATPPAAPVAGKPSASDANDFCPVGTKPNCARLMDKLGNMMGEIQDMLDDKIAELNEHNQMCSRIEKDYKEDIAQEQEQIATYNVQLTEATAEKQAKQALGLQREVERHELCEEMREKYLECHKEIKAFEEELCGLFKVRQQTYQAMTGKSPDIQDCMLGPWVPEECTKTCEGQDGIAGTQTMFRKVVAAKNDFGAKCPPMKLARACKVGVKCPVDCVVAEWTPYARCTKDCGGGSKSRAREVVTSEDHGGEPCPETTETVACNTESCDVDCVLDEWEPWGPCTKSCKASARTEPGHQYRKKHIKVAIKGKGKCPHPESRLRFGYRTCNDFKCPKGIKCSAAMDMVILLDGSGSLWWNGNFNKEKEFTKKLIKDSVMDGVDLMEQEETGKYPKHMRIGVVVFASRVKVVSKLSGKKDELIKKVDAVSWPRGATYTHAALREAMTMFSYTNPDRLKSVLLITDGRPTNRGATFRMAETVKASGVRLITLPVGRGISDRDSCKMASEPCADNVEKAAHWQILLNDLTRFVAGSCPVITV